MTDMRFNPNNGSLGKVPGQQPKVTQNDPFNVEPPVSENPGESSSISAQGGPSPSPQFSAGDVLNAANGFTGITQSSLQTAASVNSSLAEFHKIAGVAIHEVDGLFQGSLSDPQKMDLAMLALNRFMDNNPVLPDTTAL